MALTIHRIPHKKYNNVIEIEGSADGNVHLDYAHPCPNIDDINLSLDPDEAIAVASALLSSALAVKEHQAKSKEENHGRIDLGPPHPPMWAEHDIELVTSDGMVPGASVCKRCGSRWEDCGLGTHRIQGPCWGPNRFTKDL